VDHLVGHLLAVFLRRDGAPAPEERPAFPYVALLASGGHTAIYRVDGPALGAIRELGATRDDAAGEAFDKVAKLLGLEYPGGPVVDRLAAEGDAAAAAEAVPAVMARKESLEFSFSGIKSAVARHVARRGRPEGQALNDLCAAFQGAVVDALVQKTVRAARAEGVERVVLAGGVAANRGLRARMAAACARRGLALFVPPFASCTDNGAMIAYAGALRLAAGERDTLDLAPETRTALPRVTRKGGGAR
jgi:N6-L-threonylcarbamoyladenine synthase